MIISDAPTHMEDRYASILQGQTGRLIKELFDGMDFYYTNLIKCKPELTKIKQSHIKQCIQYLRLEIADRDPKLIIALGATVTKALIKKSKITELHGQVLGFEGYPVMPILHPNMAIRDPGVLPRIQADITRAKQFIKGVVPTTDHIRYTVIKTAIEFTSFISDLKKESVISIDIETTGLNRYAEGAEINCIQITLSNHTGVLPKNPKLEKRINRVKTICDDNNIEVVGQNFKFDNLWVWEKFGVRFNLGFDTMLAHHLLDENSPHGLKELSTQYCDAPAYDIDVKTKTGKGDLNTLYKYGAFDSHYTRQLRFIFEEELLDDPQLHRLYHKLTIPAARAFEQIEKNGIYIDLEKLKQSEIAFLNRKDSLIKKMNHEAGYEINWNSPKQISELLYKKLKLRVIERTPTGEPSTSEATLNRLNHPIVKTLLEYRSVEKNLSTYIVGWQSMIYNNRLYLSTKLHGTVGGRFASRLHQVPRDPEIRSHIIASPGWTFVCADYGQIELRLAAMLSGDIQMKRVFQTGGDIHSATASFVLSKPIDKLTKEERKMAKAINFGLIYGMGWRKLVLYARDNYGVDMTDQEAEDFRDRFFTVYSSLLDWHKRVRNMVNASGYVRSLSGRIRRLPGVWSPDKGIKAEAERQAINIPVQGFGSGDLKTMAIVEIIERIPQFYVKILGEVHDSILMEVRTDVIDSYIPKVKRIMEKPRLLDEFDINMTVPLEVDFEIGPWGAGEKYAN